MLRSSARLLRLLSLFQSRRYWSGTELAQELGVTGRTFRRDVERLRTLGYPVHSATGKAGGYQLGAGAHLPPLLLDDDEAVAVAIGLRTAASGSVAGIEEASLRAMSKLEQVLPARLRRGVAALQASIVPIPAAGPAPDLKTVSAIATACRDSQVLRFRYRARNSELAERCVEPHRLVHTGRRWYLVAWDLGRSDWRTFRVDRIEAEVANGARFNPRNPPEKDIAAWVSRAVAYAPYPWRARVILHAPVESAAELIPPTIGVLEAIDENTCTLRTGAHSLDMLSMYLAAFGLDFEVREPPELIRHIQRLAERFARAASETDSAFQVRSASS